MELNATADGLTAAPIPAGQEVPFADDDEHHLKRALVACKCSRTLTEEDFLIKDWADLELSLIHI